MNQNRPESVRQRSPDSATTKRAMKVFFWSVLALVLFNVVLFAKYSGTEIKVDGKKLLILRESDLLAIVEDK